MPPTLARRRSGGRRCRGGSARRVALPRGVASNAEHVVTVDLHLQVQAARQDFVLVALVAGIAKQILESDGRRLAATRRRDMDVRASKDLGRPSTEADPTAERPNRDDRASDESVEVVLIDPTPAQEDLDEEAQTQLWFG